MPAYRRLLERLKTLGVAWVQIDEPVLGFEIEQRWLAALQPVYAGLATVSPKLLLATYFESAAEHRDLLMSLPVDGVHLDLVRGPDQLDVFLQGCSPSKVLSLGVVDGRNIWRTDLDAALALVERARERLDERLGFPRVARFCTLPVDLAQETPARPEIGGWPRCGAKLDEVVALKRGSSPGTGRSSQRWRHRAGKASRLSSHGHVPIS